MWITPWTTTTTCVSTDLEQVLVVWLQAVDDNPRLRGVCGPVVDEVVLEPIHHLIELDDAIAVTPCRCIPLQTCARRCHVCWAHIQRCTGRNCSQRHFNSQTATQAHHLHRLQSHCFNGYFLDEPMFASSYSVLCLHLPWWRTSEDKQIKFLMAWMSFLSFNQ